MTYRKIGGLHWLAIGRFRFAFCRVKVKPKMLHGIKIKSQYTTSTGDLRLPHTSSGPQIGAKI